MPHATHSHTHRSLIANAAQLSPANCCSRQVSTTCLPQSPLRETERQSERVFGALLPHGCNWQVATAIKTAAQPELTINPDCLAAPSFPPPLRLSVSVTPPWHAVNQWSCHKMQSTPHAKQREVYATEQRMQLCSQTELYSQVELPINTHKHQHTHTKTDRHVLFLKFQLQFGCFCQTTLIRFGAG